MATILEDFEDATLNLAITGDWTRVQGNAAVGSWSLRSSTITHLKSTEAVVAVPAQATSVSFFYRVSSEEDYDEFVVLIDDVEVLFDSGEVPWTQVDFDVTGASEIVFLYEKDSSFSDGSDAAWIDQIEFTVPDTGTPKAATDSGALVETASVVQVPEIAKAATDSATLVEARWTDEPQSGTVPPSVRSTSTGADGAGTYTVDTPAGVALNDMLIAIQATDRGSTSQMTTPTGGTEWQLLDSLDGESEWGITQVIRVWWKRAGGAEPDWYTFKQANAGDGVCLIIAIKDASLTTDPVMNRSTDGTFLTVRTPGITPSTDSDLEIRLAAAYVFGSGLTFTPPAGLTLLDTVQSRIYTIATAAARLLESADPTAPEDFTASVDELDWTAGYTLAIAPAVTGPAQEPQDASDAGVLVESASVVVVPDAEPHAADDAATLTETAAATADVATSDMAALAETFEVEASPGGVDHAALTEASSLQLAFSGDDQALLTDTGQLDVQTAATDAGALSELVGLTETIGPVSADAGTLAETSSVVAETAAADAGALAETATAVVVKEAVDAGQLAETVSVGQDVTDAAVLAEHAAVDVVVASADSALLLDGARVEMPKSAVDAAVFAEHAEVVDIGRAIGGVELIRRGWSAQSPRRRWAAGRPRRAWRTDSPHT